MTTRIITESMRKIFLEKWQANKQLELLGMLRTVNPRIWEVICNNEFKPIEVPFGSAFLFGKVGTGKSVQAAWRMLEWSRLKAIYGKAKQDAIFINMGDLLRQIKNTYESSSQVTEQEIVTKFISIDLLVLDDFGALKTTDWVYDILYYILEKRYSNMVPTIITSNLSLAEIGQKLGDERLISRISHDCKGNILHFTGESKRK